MKKLVAVLMAMLMALSIASFASATQPIELIWWMGTAADAPIDQPLVEAALNEITAKEFGITIKCIYMTGEQVALAMSSGQYFDMTFTCGWYNDFQANAADGMFYDIKDKVKEVTPALYASMPEEVWGGGYYRDALLGIPNMKDYGIEVFWIIDIDYFVTEKGMEVPWTMSFTDIEPFLATYKADFPADYPLKLPKEGITSWSNFIDWIGSAETMMALSYNEQGTDKATKIELCFEMPEFAERITTIHNWYEAGYITPDAAVIATVPRAQGGFVQSGQGFYGADSIWSNARQRASAISRYDGPFISTFSLQGALTAISAASKNVDAALKIIEYANTNAAYRNLMRYGIEGTHFNFNADGTVSKTAQGASNYSPWAYVQASYSLSAVEASAFPSVPADPNMWSVVWEGYKDATYSAQKGFAFDPTDVYNELNACKAIRQMYWFEMQTGTTDPAVMFPQLIKELEDAGIRAVIAEAQKQLDEHLAAQ